MVTTGGGSNVTSTTRALALPQPSVATTSIALLAGGSGTVHA